MVGTLRNAVGGPVSEPDPRASTWVRYSAGRELPIASATSVAIHSVLLVLLLVAGLYLGDRMHEGNGGMPTAVIEVQENGDSAQLAGTTQFSAPRERAPLDVRRTPTPTPREQPKLEVPQPPQINFSPAVEPPRPPVEQFDGIQHEIQRMLQQDELRRSLQRPRPGPSTGPPDGKGGPGSKLGGADPNGEMRRIKRAKRWHLTFHTADVGEHVRQLAALGAILAFPQGDGRYVVVRNLSQRPAKGAIEDVGKINRIFWVDNEPTVAKDLAAHLGVGGTPRYFVAFFPEALEQQMQGMEQHATGRTEEAIGDNERFDFEVVRRDGSYVVMPAGRQ